MHIICCFRVQMPFKNKKTRFCSVQSPKRTIKEITKTTQISNIVRIVSSTVCGAK
jgi:hypothetical protein